MKRLWETLTTVFLGGLLLAVVPTAPAQHPKPAPAPKASAPMPATQQQPMTAASPQPRHRVVVVEPIRVFDPFFDYPYPYAYEPDYMSSNFGYVKIKTDEHKDAAVYVDGGFADKIDKSKKYALRPGTHEIELRDSDGRTLLKERVAVIVGKTTEIKAG